MSIGNKGWQDKNIEIPGHYMATLTKIIISLDLADLADLSGRPLKEQYC